MLLKCPECELQVSDKALTCPHCGYPMKEKTSQKRNATKHKRLPNGFGQISEIKNQNLRNPFRAMVTVGKNSVGRPICKPLKPQAFFRTYNEAYAALVEYNKNPYDLNKAMSVKELYDKWSDEYFEKLKSPSSIRTITSAWAYCSELYDMRVCDVRARHIKGCMDNGVANIKGEERHASVYVQGRIKSLFNIMLDYAVEYEIVDRNYARTFNVSDEVVKEIEAAKRSHIPFTDEEMRKLWDAVDTVPYVNVLLVQCYSGWRPQELGLIEISNVDLDDWSFVGGMKTEAGTDRYVPIHEKIRGLVRKAYDESVASGSKYLFNCYDTKTHCCNTMLTYDKYRERMKRIVGLLNLNPDHRAHDGRVHFVTICKKYNVDEYAIKYMVGHAINDVTEKVYTQRDKEWLHEEISKIK